MPEKPKSIDKKDNDDNEKVPWLARLWLAAYSKVPPIYFPGTKLSFSFSMASALVLIVIRVLLEYLVFIPIFKWPDYGCPATKAAASGAAAMTHSSMLVPAVIVAFWSRKAYNPGESLNNGNNNIPIWWKQYVDAILQFCTGYMAYDAIINIVIVRAIYFGPHILTVNDDYLILIHHFVTALYMTMTRQLQAGHQSAMICMLLGEITNPVHNFYRILEMGKTDLAGQVEISETLYVTAEITFSIFYNFIRAVVGPFVMFHLTVLLLFSKSSQRNLPLSVRIFWSLIIWGVMIGSVSLVLRCHDTYMKRLFPETSNDGVVEQEL